MRYGHFEVLQPCCPACRAAGRIAPLDIAERAREDAAGLLEGRLCCNAAGCRREYPVIDGVPVLMADVGAYLRDHAAELLYRDDLGDGVAGMVGDALGQDTAYDAIRNLRSTYGWCQFADRDPDGDGTPSSTVGVLDALLSLAGELPDGPTLDLGCALGRGALELAGLGGGLALGVDLDLAMLRAGQRMLRTGELRVPLRRSGVVYETRTLRVDTRAADRVDLWACDACALPLADGAFATVAALNTLDSVRAPIVLLREVARALAPGGKALLSTPYEWLEPVTPREAWIGGHSARGDHRGAGDSLLRSLLTPGAHPQAIEGLALAAEREGARWRVRLHDRRIDEFRAHLVVAERRGGGA